ncbi:hypothetical protein KFE25_011254 [Diacronema lutheri]|uniref:EXPERA domain-containing protein n=1 Tax=Diacronema lutheri TaxID=2081491 RepID=A0A8J5XG43_DIALT|nr:hypothetical protein KFE25_011254 [Diacronema lutheri]
MGGNPAWRRATDVLIVAYLLAHGVIALACDVQSILPDFAPGLHARYAALGLVDVVQRWGREQGDFLVLTNPPWFKALIWGELIYQVPSCFVLGAAWARRRPGVWLPALVYAVHVLSTMAPIFFELCADARPTRTCLAVYAVWVALPLVILARCVAAGPTGARLFLRAADDGGRGAQPLGQAKPKVR